jgi:uncharacterized membrane protein (DUF373 family)
MLQHPSGHEMQEIGTSPSLNPIATTIPSPLTQPPGTGIVPWYRKFRRSYVVRVLESVQDLIAVSLCIGLFCVMVLQLKEIFLSLMTTLQFHEITADILFILILVELFRLLIIYLQEQRVSIGVSVEVAIVSVLREVIVKGVLEVEWQQVIATCAFLLSMAVLLVVRVWIPPTFEGINPEQQVSDRVKEFKSTH